MQADDLKIKDAQGFQYMSIFDKPMKYVSIHASLLYAATYLLNETNHQLAGVEVGLSRREQEQCYT